MITIDLKCADYKDYLRHNAPLLRVDAVITDPPYDLQEKDLLAWFEPICHGNIIMFCKPENQFYKPDEYLFWIKTPSTKNFVKACGRFVEMILVRRKGNTFNHLYWSQMIGVYDDRMIYPTEHPYEKPLSLLERLVRIYTNEGDKVFDPFAGSGTTGLACKNLHRNFIGCEINFEYYLIAQKKLGIYGVRENPELSSGIVTDIERR